MWLGLGARGWEWEWEGEGDVENRGLCELGSVGGLVEGCGEVDWEVGRAMLSDGRGAA